ncbi:MAG: hypothetical protein COB04_06380 [Gammaproteobacteria bacterium]|nr:MAG: hypothetical protein COB04_06380 [Gammaproteobacteria bacterium]
MKPIIKIILAATGLFFSAHALSLDKGQPLPLFALKDLHSGKLTHSSDFHGKVVYIDFWATWCSPCLKGLPKLETLQNSFSKDKFEVIAINVNDDVDTVETYLEQIGLDLLVLSDPMNLVLESFKLKGIPTGYLIDQQGQIVLVHTGYGADFIKHLEKAVRQQINKS